MIEKYGLEWSQSEGKNNSIVPAFDFDDPFAGEILGAPACTIGDETCESCQ